MADYGHRRFDPAAGLLCLSMDSYRNVHSEHLDLTPRHPVRESLNYALILLELSERSLQGRAEAIIERVLSLQETADPSALNHGLWPYFLEEPVKAWPWPDLNWADFNAMTLLLIRHRHCRRLGASLLKEIDAAIGRAALCIRRRNVDLNYTNIAIKGTFVTLSAAEIAGDADLLGYALDRLRRLRDTVAAAGAFAEYNSPTYAAISLAGLHSIASYVAHPEAAALVAPLVERFWSDVSERFHTETRELAGPHARAYAATLGEAPELLGSFIEKASRGLVVYPLPQGRDTFNALYACVMNVDAPPEVRERLCAINGEARQVSARSHARPDEAPRAQTTWLEPAFCLGAVSFQDGWEQRNNLIAYWKSPDGAAGFLRHRYLRDERPCCSGHFVSRQEAGAVAAGAFIAAYADHHVSVPTDGTTCGFLGPVIELNAAGEKVSVFVNGRRRIASSSVLRPGDVVRIELAGVAIEWTLTEHDVVGPVSAGRPRLELTAPDRLRIVLPHYEGERRELKWTDFDRAVSAYRLRMAAADRPMPAWEIDVALPDGTPASKIEAEAWGLEQARMVELAGSR